MPKRKLSMRNIYMVAVDEPRLDRNPTPEQRVQNIRRIDGYNEELVDKFDRMARRMEHNPEDYRIDAVKGVSMVLIEGSETLMKDLANTQGDFIKWYAPCTPEGSRLLSKRPDGPQAAPAYVN
jgi:hypothetical protein